jgi:hypothetical protein
MRAAEIKLTAKNTVRVTNAIAESLGWSSGESKRLGQWGYYIGNVWAKTRKELHAKFLNDLALINNFGDLEVLRNAKCRFNVPLFKIS